MTDTEMLDWLEANCAIIRRSQPPGMVSITWWVSDDSLDVEETDYENNIRDAIRAAVAEQEKVK